MWRFLGISQFKGAHVSSARLSSGVGPPTASPRQIYALAAATARELLWGLRAVSREVGRWRALAATIPDQSLRDDALRAIHRKRANIDGAALFWTLPQRRDTNLLRALVAFEVLADFLDCASERGAHLGIANGLCMHRALQDAFSLTTPANDYYRHHYCEGDGGYTALLIATCRQTCAWLPSFHVVSRHINHAASLMEVLALNHETDSSSRDRMLLAWAKAHFDQASDIAWFEWCGGASAWLTIFALLALAANPESSTAEAKAVCDAYLWVSLAGTMLDSYVDAVEDTAEGAHSYIGHYPNRQAAIERVIQLVRRAHTEIAPLPDAHRHAVIVICMVAMYLSKDSARTREARMGTEKIVCANGNLGRLLIHVLRAWRIFYHQRSD